MEKKVLKNKYTNMAPLQFLQFIRLRKSKGKKLCFPLRILISAILFKGDCAIKLVSVEGAGRLFSKTTVV